MQKYANALGYKVAAYNNIWSDCLSSETIHFSYSCWLLQVMYFIFMLTKSTSNEKFLRNYANAMAYQMAA